jgi:hypothetical protein
VVLDDAVRRRDCRKDIQARTANRVSLVLERGVRDFMALSVTTATGATWIVPTKSVDKVGEEGFKKALGVRGESIATRQDNAGN